MKPRKLFTLTFAAMAFAACSNDDDTVNGGNNELENGGIVDQIGISFVTSGTTYAEDVLEGTGTENNVYKAFIFAHENNAEGLMPGDWSVEEVGDGVSVLNGTTLKSMAVFNRVTMGENVYVLVNVPGLTLVQAEALAHQGDKSEQAIKDFVYKVSKGYLNDLAYANNDNPTGQFIMSGMSTIPTNPATLTGKVVTVPVEMNRDMSKVYFAASVTGDNMKEAYGRVKIDKAEDGIVIARVARQLSPFSTQEKEWYFPLSPNGDDMDWGHNSSNIDTWEVVFDGITQDAPDVPTTTSGFNAKETKETAAEYRYSWVNSDMLTIDDSKDPNGKLTSPYFYVSPNYSKESNCVSVICTQATYTGAPVFKDENANILFEKAYSKYIIDNEANFKNADGNAAPNFSDCVWDDTSMEIVSTYFSNDQGADTDLQNSTDLTEAEINTAGNIIKTVNKALSANELLSYHTGQKLYYRADIAGYDAANSKYSNLTEKNTYYQIQGTITSMGAPSIDEAIRTDNIGMLITVKVMPWKVVVNRVDM